MKRVVLLIMCVSMFATAQEATTQPKSNCCDVVENALRLAQQVKPGDTRASLDRTFVADGGLSFPTSATFTLKSCHYLKLDVEFRVVDPKRGFINGFDPNDVITKVSRLYVDYPRAD